MSALLPPPLPSSEHTQALSNDDPVFLKLMAAKGILHSGAYRIDIDWDQLESITLTEYAPIPENIYPPVFTLTRQEIGDVRSNAIRLFLLTARRTDRGAEWLQTTIESAQRVRDGNVVSLPSEVHRTFYVLVNIRQQLKRTVTRAFIEQDIDIDALQRECTELLKTTNEIRELIQSILT